MSRLKDLARSILAAPFSPPIFRTACAVGWGLGLLPKPRARVASVRQTILVVHPFSSVGDFVLLLPFLEDIRERFPDASIHLAIGQAMFSFAQMLSCVDKVIRVETVPHHGLLGWRIREMRTLFSAYRRKLAREQYDIAIAPRWSSDSYGAAARYLTYLTQATCRVAYSADVDGGDLHLDDLMTAVAMGGQGKQEVERSLRLLDFLQAQDADSTEVPSVFDPLQQSNTLMDIAKANEAAIETMVGSPGHGYIVISPGGTKGSNLWPADRFADVSRKLYEAYQLKVFVIGGGADAGLCELLAASAPEAAVSLAGRTSMGELLAILRQARLFVGNDSGPAHLAASVGCPSIVINPFPSFTIEEHPNSASRFRPVGPNVTVLQPEMTLAPCVSACYMKEAHCILQIEVQDVLRTASRVLEMDNPESKTLN